MGHDSSKHLQSSTAASYLNKKKNHMSKHIKKATLNIMLIACQLSFTSLEAGAKQSCLCKAGHRLLLFPQQ